MRRTKILSLFALLLALAMLLVSCGGTGAGTVEVKSLLDKKATVESDAYGDIEKVTGLTDVTRRSNAGDLYYFTAETEVGNETYTKHIVYNAATNQILTTLTNSETVEHSVQLLSGYDYLTEENYFSAYFTFASNYDSEEEPTGASATLYAADGTLVDSKSYTKEEMENVSSDSFAAKLDLVLFDDVLYRANAEGIEKLMDVDPFAGLPGLDELQIKVGNYYYSNNDDSTFKAYDESLQFLASYELPEYAELIGATVLGNGNLLVQYKYMDDVLSEE
ncbi:MAG: hypothetical protein J6V07_07525, partial [Clostridia bacterium]|nr:hypothetical protein [Clostridia bacterium]